MGDGVGEFDEHVIAVEIYLYRTNCEIVPTATIVCWVGGQC